MHDVERVMKEGMASCVSRAREEDAEAADLRLASRSVVEQKNTEPHGIHKIQRTTFTCGHPSPAT